MAIVQLKQKDWTKDGRKWIFMTYYNDLEGNRKQFKSMRFMTKKEAIEAERDFIKEKVEYKINTNTMTFKELIDSYYEYQSDKVKATTMLTYKDRIRYMDELNKIKVNEFTIQHYEVWRKKILTYDLSNRTRNYIFKFLKAIMNYGTKWYGINFMNVYNRMANFSDPNEIKKEMLFFTFDEFQQFISVEESLLLKAFYETLYYCGLRKGEARALTWKDFRRDDRTVDIHKGVSDNVNGERFIVTSPKTPTSNRILPVPKVLYDDYVKLYEERKRIYGFKDTWFIFGTNIPLGDSALTNHKNKNCKNAGVKQIRIHDFRHSCASFLINCNANITLVAKFLGHAKIEETLNTYSHMFKNSMDDIIKIIDTYNEKNQVE